MLNAKKINFVLFSGLVPEQEGQVEKVGPHKEGSRPSGPQRSPSELLRSAAHPRGDGAKGAAETGAKDLAAVGEAAEEDGGKGDPRRHGNPEEEVGEEADQWQR